MTTEIVPHSKAHGIDFLGTNDYYYIVRSDIGVYLKSSNFHGGSDIEIFDLHLSCQNGEHYLASVEGYFYIIKGDSYRRVRNMKADTDAQVFPLHPNCRGGDNYYSVNESFYIVFQDRGVYRTTTNMKEDHDGQEFPIHENCKNGLYYWGRDEYVYILEPVRNWGVEYRRATNLKDDSNGKLYSMHRSVVDFLPGGLAITQGSTFAKWEQIKSIANDSDVEVHWSKEISHLKGVKRSELSTIEHNWKIQPTVSGSAGNLAGAFARAQFALQLEYGGKKVNTKNESWEDVKEVKEKIEFKLDPHQQVWIWQYLVGLGKEDILFCRDIEATNTNEPPTDDPLPLAN
ncbi:Hypothetical predicted protein [Paramuricea clavata]|uniref:Uncharacterized protein n=1 Tax=Paramuricea clavata TaxID=317549 RepID=A0A7D9IEX3_PARCT|nr:Hypothetical predicted protein [Paramuricea clavata]